MRKIVTLMLVLSLICSFSFTAFAEEVSEPEAIPQEGTESTVEPSEPENDTTEPSESENSSESSSEPSEPSSEPFEPETTEPETTEPEASEPETPTVNISEESIQAIADAVVGDGSFTITFSNGDTFVLYEPEESDSYYTKYHNFIDAWATYKYKLISQQSTSGWAYAYFFDELPGEAEYIDSSGRWYIRGCQAQAQLGLYTTGTANNVSYFSTNTTNNVNVFPDFRIWSNFHVVGEGGVLLHESDTPIMHWVSFNTGFEDLTIDRMTSVMFNAPTPVYEGYQFAGWYLDAEFTQPYTSEYIFSEDTTLYAKWLPYVTVTVVTGFDDYTVEPIQVLSGEVFHLPGFSYPNHQFMGAYTADDFNASSQFYSGTIVDEDITLYLWFEPLDNTSLLKLLLDRMEGLIYVQMASIIMLVALLVLGVFFNRRNG